MRDFDYDFFDESLGNGPFIGFVVRKSLFILLLGLDLAKAIGVMQIVHQIELVELLSSASSLLGCFHYIFYTCWWES